MSNVVDLSELTSEVSSVLTMYAKEVNDDMLKWMEKTAKDAAKDLKKIAPSKSGKYAKGWTATKDGSGWKVHNKKRAGLAHLTEHGHPIIRDGRVVGHAPAITHIKTEELKVIDKVKELENTIKGVH